ncbi:MAG: FliO/MopB family protein [Myxococcota bacterium]
MLRSVVLSLVMTFAAAPAWAQPPPEAPPLAAPTTAPAVPQDDGARTAEPELPRAAPPELEGAEELNLGWTLFRTMLVLAIVVGLAWLTLNVGLRRLLGIKPVVGTSLVTVLERVPLDQKRSLFVVEAAGEVLLVGGGDGALSLISKLDRAEVERLRAAASAQRSVQLSPFLQKLLGRKDAPPPAPPAS